MRWFLGVVACICPASVDAASLSPIDLPKDMLAVIQHSIPGMKVTGAERKERDGRIYHDVEGVRPDGAAVELDLLQTPNGWKVVEIQRDIAWKDVPRKARDVALPALDGTTPARVIESRQMDGRIIYELFKPSAPEAPAFEVMVDRGKASLLTEIWPH